MHLMRFRNISTMLVPNKNRIQLGDRLQPNHISSSYYSQFTLIQEKNSFGLCLFVCFLVWQEQWNGQLKTNRISDCQIIKKPFQFTLSLLSCPKMYGILKYNKMRKALRVLVVFKNLNLKGKGRQVIAAKSIERKEIKDELISLNFS